MAKKLNVLVVDDSDTARYLISHIVNAAPDMCVIGEARTGQQAIELTRDLKPDIIVMDVIMPEMDGMQATREIMHTLPTPIVMISANAEKRENEFAFQAIKAGALTIMPKPVGPRHPNHSTQADALLNVLRTMAGVRVIHHWKPRTAPFSTTTTAEKDRIDLSTAEVPEIVAIVSSTGGPAALSEIIGRLPSDFALPVVVVQHISSDFLPSLANWLTKVTPLQVVIAQPRQVPSPGVVYLAPSGTHLVMTKARRFYLDEVTTGRHVPSGDVLFESVAKVYGARAVGVVLTGMGNDGARGLCALYDSGAFTISQNEETSVIFGMPGEAISAGAAKLVLPISEIAGSLVRLSESEEVFS